MITKVIKSGFKLKCASFAGAIRSSLTAAGLCSILRRPAQKKFPRPANPANGLSERAAGHSFVAPSWSRETALISPAGRCKLLGQLS